MPNDKDTARALQKKFFGNPQGLAQHLVNFCLNSVNVVREVFLLLDNFSTLDVGCRFLNLLPTATLLKMVKSKIGKAFGSELLIWLSTLRHNSSEGVCPGVDFVIELKRLKDAVDNSSPQDDGKGYDIPFAKLKEGEDIRLSPFVVEKLKLIAAAYHAATGKSITITDGNRTAAEQAFLMIPQIEKGKIHLYTQKQAAAEVKKVYDAGKAARKSKDQIVQDIAKVIQNQINNGVFLSRHLRDKGADIRFSDMSLAERKVFSQIVIKNGGDPLIEDDHFHLQF